VELIRTKIFLYSGFICLVLVCLFIPTENAKAYGNSEIAEALAYSGCTFGLVLDVKQFGMQQTVDSDLNLGLSYRIIDEGESTDLIDKMDTPKGRTGYQHLLQSWATAGALSSKWKSLESTYEKGLLAGLKRWRGGATLGVSGDAANSAAVPKLTALCRIAEIAVTSKAKKAKMPLRQYIIKVSGKYLPPLP